VAVVTWVSVINVCTSRVRITGIICANVAIVAVKGRATDAHTARAEVVRRARITVALANLVVVAAGAPGNRITPVIRTNVAVVAIKRRAADTPTARTGVIRRTGVEVIARVGVVDVHAPGSRIA
jgi:hypothetical protein